MKRILLLGLLALAVIGGAFFMYHPAKRNTTQPLATTNSAPQSLPKPAPQSPTYPIDQPSSLWMIVNKQRALPASYTPAPLETIGGDQLRSEAASSLRQLLADAKAQGVGLAVVSGYRSYANQQSVYNSYVTRDGQTQADTYSARPGHSEHQTGLAVDVGNVGGACDLEICFADTAGGKWVADHAHEYGFIIRYQAGKTNLTGYQYEPWHLRFVGTDLAKTLHTSGQTMEQYFNLPAATNY